MTATTTGAPSEKAVETIEKVRPLNATQARAAAKLVANDYAQAYAELEQHVQQRKKETRERITREHQVSAPTAEQVRAEAEHLSSDINRMIREFVAEKEDQGITVQFTDPSGRVITQGRQAVGVGGIDSTGLRSKIEAEFQVINQQYTEASTALRRAHLKAERVVLKAQITGTVEDLLDTIPDPATLFQQVQEGKADTGSQITAT